MITISKGDPLVNNPELIVFSESGDYEETALIECTTIDNPDFPICAYAAQYVKYGDPVYQQTEPLNENQVAALEMNAPLDDVLNNQELIDGKINPESLAVEVNDSVSNQDLGQPAKAPRVIKNLNEDSIAPVVNSEDITNPTNDAATTEPQVGDIVGENQ